MKDNRTPEELMENVHSHIPDAFEQLKQGRVSRREFLRLATLLGMSVGAATALAACGGAEPEPADEPEQEEEPESEAPQESDEPSESTEEPEPADTSGSIQRGGTLVVGSSVPAIDHPARFAWIFDANQFRHVFEYLTETDKDNITHPYLLEKWEANDELTEWTLYLRKGIKWTNGDELVADHVVFNFGEWLNPDVQSSILGLWEGFLTMDGIEVVDDYTIKLNLDAPLLAVPEYLFHYPAQIMHPSFDGDITSGKNPSTGPMVLDEYKVGEFTRVKRREDDGYWQMGEDGKPLPYLDAIEWVDLGDDQTAAVAAIQSGQIHNMYEPTVDTFLALRNDSNIVIEGLATANVRLLRVRVDQEPWDNEDVRNAFKMIQDREKILDQAYFGEGIVGHDVHVCPVQPEFAPMDVPEYDPEGAKALLEGAGFGDGLDVAISVGTGWTDIVAYAETLQEDGKAAGFNITLDTMPNSAFWDLWDEATVAITPWTHRPLAVMLLPLAYIADSSGDPVPWNESRWVDEEFTELLLKAQGLLDVEARREVMVDLQRVMQERGPVSVAYWRNVWNIRNPAFQNMEAHPTNYNLWREVWYDPSKDPFA